MLYRDTWDGSERAQCAFTNPCPGRTSMPWVRTECVGSAGLTSSCFLCIWSCLAEHLPLHLLPSAVDRRKFRSLAEIAWQPASCCAGPDEPSHTGDAHEKTSWWSLGARPSMIRANQPHQVQSGFCCWLRWLFSVLQSLKGFVAWDGMGLGCSKANESHSSCGTSQWGAPTHRLCGSRHSPGRAYTDVVGEVVSIPLLSPWSPWFFPLSSISQPPIPWK